MRDSEYMLMLSKITFCVFNVLNDVTRSDDVIQHPTHICTYIIFMYLLFCIIICGYFPLTLFYVL